MDEVLTIIDRYGFPIFVAVWVLIRLNGKMDRLTAALGSLEKALTGHLSRDMVRAVIREVEYERAVAEDAHDDPAGCA